MVISDQFRWFNQTVNFSLPDLEFLIEYHYVVFDSLGKRESRINSSDNKLNWLDKDFQQKLETYSWINYMDSHFSFRVSILDMSEQKFTVESTKIIMPIQLPF